MGISKVIFRYSWVYDNRYRNNAQFKRYPSVERVKSFAKSIEPAWRKEEKRVLSLMSKIMGLEWQEKNVLCYVVGKCRAFSDPLTIGIYLPKDKFVDVLAHEMIHQLQAQNDHRMKKWFSYVSKKYPKAELITKNHILLHAVHKEIYLKLYGQKRFLRDSHRVKWKNGGYKESWDIVNRDGHKEIIAKFRELSS